MIQDFGAKIDGAAKDRWRSYLDRMGAVRDQDIGVQPLSRSFPEPNYAALLRDGADPWTVAFVRSLRETIPAKPRGGLLPAWSRLVVSLRRICHDLLDGNIDTEMVARRLASPAMAKTGERIESHMALYMALGHDRSLKDLKLKAVAYSFLEGVRYDPPLSRHEVRDGRDRVLAFGSNQEQAIEAYRQLIEATPDQPAPSGREVKFDIYRKRGQDGVIIGKKIGSTYIDLHHAPDVSAARKFRDEHAAELVERLERLKTPPAERRADNLPRSGASLRNGRDVTPEEFLEAFAFRGVQFGNYVEQERRQQDLNDAWDALMDLAMVLDVEPSALSLRGRLGLAFGARGKGGIGAAKAHYEPVEEVINLTKPKGAGSLAHEWFHGLDNAIARCDGSMIDYATERTVRTAAGLAREDQDMLNAMRAIRDAIARTGMVERSAQLDTTRSKDYWSTGRELAARAFEAWVIEKLEQRGIRNDYLANIVDEAMFEAEAALMGQPPGRYPYPKAAEMPVIDVAFLRAFGAESFGLRSFLGAPVAPPEFRVVTDPERPLREGQEPSVSSPIGGNDPGSDPFGAAILPASQDMPEPTTEDFDDLTF